jgi:hypothetical protein
MIKDKFAPARRERAAHEYGNIFVTNMSGFFLTSALVRHARIQYGQQIDVPASI